jgi:hypothetical protein
MKWFDQWFFKKWCWAWANKDNPDEFRNQIQAKASTGLSILAPDEAWEDGLRITIKKMIGGSVVSFRVYDKRTDRTDTRNYIITDEQDFNAELGKIITMESMRQS